MRLDDHGKPRELQLDKAVAVTDFSGTAFKMPKPVPVGAPWLQLASQPEFVLDRAEFGPDTPAAGAADGSSMQLLTVVHGRATLSPVGGVWQPVELSLGATVLVPARMPGGYRLLGSGSVVRSSVPA